MFSGLEGQHTAYRTNVLFVRVENVRVEKCEKSSKMDQFSRFSRKISLYSTMDVWVELDPESRPPPIPKLAC